jgi:putative FmdB family regulatory protein
MPIYAYRCPNCNATEERFRGITQRDRALPCRKCGGDMKPVLVPDTGSDKRAKQPSVFKKV